MIECSSYSLVTPNSKNRASLSLASSTSMSMMFSSWLSLFRSAWWPRITSNVYSLFWAKTYSVFALSKIWSFSLPGLGWTSFGSSLPCCAAINYFEYIGSLARDFIFSLISYAVLDGSCARISLITSLHALSSFEYWSLTILRYSSQFSSVRHLRRYSRAWSSQRFRACFVKKLSRFKTYWGSRVSFFFFTSSNPALVSSSLVDVGDVFFDAAVLDTLCASATFFLFLGEESYFVGDASFFSSTTALV